MTQFEDSTTKFVGISTMDADVVWVSDEPDLVAHPQNGGRTWRTQNIAGNDSLMFRDVHAFPPDDVIIASLGPGSLARLYRSSNADASWELMRQETEPDIRAPLRVLTRKRGKTGWPSPLFWGNSILIIRLLLTTYPAPHR